MTAVGASLHHTHLLCTDVEATVAFWQTAFGAQVIHDVVAAGARNVFVQRVPPHLQDYSAGV